MSTYEISKSSLLSLKAEILRKQDELVKTKQQNKIKILNIKKNTPLDLKNKNVEQREKNDRDPEEENLLKKSRSALEAKSRLYEKLVKGASKFTDDDLEHNRRYLVRFDKKCSNNVPPPDSDGEMDVDRYPESDEEERHFSDEYELASNPDEEWVEYTDCLGRTRKCLRKDLEFVKSKDKEFRSTIDERKIESGQIRDPVEEEKQEKERTEVNEVSENSELLSSDMRRELLRQQWEKEEEELRDKTDIHYQDILFGEARTHGVGYYGFSKDEEERSKQQDALKKLREETEQQQRKAQELRQMRQKQLAARTKAAKNRRRARLGLPPEEDVESSTEEKKEEVQTIDEEELKRKKEIEEKQKQLELKRKKHIRPWDIGKEGVKKHREEYSQEEWVEKQRKERNNEFAPPAAYKREFKSSTIYEEAKETRDKRLYFSTKKSNQNAKRSDENDQNQSTAYNNPIIDECVEETNSDNAQSFSNVKRKGAEIAPPPTYDYYGPTSTKKPKQLPMNNPKENIEDSIAAGLKYLRQQAEKRVSSNKHDSDMFLS